MSFEIGAAFIPITARDETARGVSSATRNVTDQVDETTTKTKKSFSGMVKGMAPVAGALSGMFAGAKIAGFIKDSVTGWQDHQRVLSQTAAVIKSTGGAAGVTVAQMDDLSGSIERNTGVDGDAVLAGQNMLLTFTNLKNGVGEGNDVFNQATQTLTDMSVATGSDMKASAIQLGKALNDPIKGISALSKVGVTFTDQQKESIKAMVAQGDAAGAQKVILAELNKEFGGSAKAQMTSSKKMQIALNDLADTIGQYLVPMITKVSEFTSGKLIPAFTSTLAIIGRVAAFVKENQRVFIGLGIAIALITAATAAHSLVLAINSGALKAWFIQTKIVQAATKSWAAIQWVLNAALAANPIAIVVIALVALVAGVVLAYQKVAWFRAVVDGAFKGIVGAAGFLGRAFTSLWNNVIGPVIRAIVGGFLGLVSTIVGGAARAFGWVPGIGGKLKGAAAAVERFKNDANASLARMTKTVNVSANTSPARQSISRLVTEIGSRTAYLRVVTLGPNGPTGGRQAFAKGGFPSDGEFTVGEEGPELMRKKGSQLEVLSNPQTRRVLSSAGKGSENGAARVQHFHHYTVAVSVSADDIHKVGDLIEMVEDAGARASTGVNQEDM